jgi:branched-chain amino acid transport system permease protein
MAVINLAGINVIIALGYFLLLGLTGQLNLAQAGFMGVGAYAAGLLTVKAGWSVWPSALVAVAVAALGGVLLGLPSFRLRGHYLAIATLGFNIIFVLVLRNWETLTNGSDGIPGIPSPVVFGFELGDKSRYYYLVLACVGFCIALAAWLRKSRFGMALQGIREDEIAAMAAGVDVFRYKVFGFALCAAYCGLGGVLYAHLMRFVSPGDFAFSRSFSFLIMSVLGGVQSIAGTVVGAALVTILPEWLRFLEDIYMLIFALSVLFIMIFLPSGLAGGVQTLVKGIRRRLESDQG